MNDNEFGFRIRQALNEGLTRFDYKTSYRLEQARNAALAAHAGRRSVAAWSPALATAGGPTFGTSSGVGWLQRLGMAAPLLALAIGFVGIYEHQRAERISEQANIDFAVLLDEVPIDAYADKGFGALLQGHDEES
jgi:hypothetical protein